MNCKYEPECGKTRHCEECADGSGSRMSALLAAGHPMDMFGIRITTSPNCLEETSEPVKKHERKSWMRAAYHDRIQKKWNKRFGFRMEPVMYQTPHGILCHPSLLLKIRKDLSGS